MGQGGDEEVIPACVLLSATQASLCSERTGEEASLWADRRGGSGRYGGADHVIEIGGTGTFKQALMALKQHGSLAIIGLLEGAKVGLNVARFFGKRLRMNGITVGSRADFEAMNACIAETRLRPAVSQVFPLSDVSGAFEAMHTGGMVGNIVVEIGGGASRL